jgi:hypothetical protein
MQTGILAGTPFVVATQGAGHGVEFWADRLLERIIHCADTAHPEIRAQANEFRVQLKPLLLHFLKAAIKSDRTTLFNRLKQYGLSEAALAAIDF